MSHEIHCSNEAASTQIISANVLTHHFNILLLKHLPDSMLTHFLRQIAEIHNIRWRHKCCTKQREQLLKAE